jgi:hypothetical protein
VDKGLKNNISKVRPSLKLQTNTKSIRKSSNHNYAELCEKLGKDKLLIEEDEDISALIYQGMAKKN